MNLNDFVYEFDKPGNVVLLEGKRQVAVADQSMLILLGQTLTTATRHILFRSGNAKGADAFFSEGVASVNAARLQIIKPYKAHRIAKLYTNNEISLDEINILEEPELIYKTKQNKEVARLAEAYQKGFKGLVGNKAALILRDTLKVTGSSTIPPANFAIFYDDLSNAESGGTGHTMKMCRLNNVPFVNQLVWNKWL